ncbi:MAG: copper chaperone NosL [Maribacter sp.]|jgi:copper chaperone NosL
MKKASIIMMIGSLLLMGLFVFPLWNIELGAPQYPEPLGMDIYIDGIQGQNEFDLQNIDGLNHYIGMKILPKPKDMWEFTVFPLVIGGMAALGVLFGLLGFLDKVSYKWFFGWLILMSVLGVLGMYDFNAWMTDYGTNLDPKAIMKLAKPDGTPMSYKPPLFGHQKMLNFDAYSYPRLGAYLMFAGMVLTLVAVYMGWKKRIQLVNL